MTIHPAVRLSRPAGLLAVACAAGLAAGLPAAPALAQSLTPSAPGASPAPAPAEQRRRAFDVMLFGVQGLRNGARLPNDSSATRYALESLTGSGADGSGRLEVIWPVGARSELRGRITPLSIDGRAPLAQAVAFQGQPFGADTGTTDYHRLDAYHLTWRYSLLDAPQMSMKVGLTARVRDARVAPRPGTAAVGKTDAGIVPLLHASIEGALANGLSMVADIDALGGAQGRAIDAGVRLRYAIDRDWSASVSYRILDGGTDESTPYSLGRFQYFGVGVRRAF